MLSPELGPRGGQFDSDFSFFPSPSLPMHAHFPRPSKMDRMLHLLLLQNCCLHCSKQVNCPHLTVYPNESSPEKEESRYTSRTSSEEEGSTRKTSHTYRLQKRIQHLRKRLCNSKHTLQRMNLQRQLDTERAKKVCRTRRLTLKHKKKRWRRW